MSKRRYRKISVYIWNDAKFMALSHDAKLIVFFMLTHPALTQIGALRANVPGLACELGMDLEAFTKGFEEVLAQGIIKHDAKLLFWFPNFLKYNLPESPNVVKSWHYGYNELPESQLKTVILEGVRAVVDGLSQGFREAFAKTFAEELVQSSQNQRTESREQKAKKQEVSTKPFVSSEKSSVTPTKNASESSAMDFSSSGSTHDLGRNLNHDSVKGCGQSCSQSHVVPSQQSKEQAHVAGQPTTSANALPSVDPAGGVSSFVPLRSSVSQKKSQKSFSTQQGSSCQQGSTSKGCPSGLSNPAGQQRSQSQQTFLEQQSTYGKSDDSVQPCPYVQVQALYNKICTRLPRCRDMTAQRKSRLKSVWNSASKRQTLSWWEEYFTLVDKSDFLSGNNDRGWTANFDWILKPVNMVKIEEGSYQSQRVKSPSKPVSKAAFVTANNQAVYEAMMQKG